MALESKKEGNLLLDLLRDVELPKMVKVHQLFDTDSYNIAEIPSIVYKELDSSGISKRIRPGMKIAITCGSRGVANIAEITKAIVYYIYELGACPFVFPAMGSHGGARAEGQREILHSYGVTEAFLGCPIISSMETVHIGDTPDGMKVYLDKAAFEADGIILCNRVKAHTAFRGPYESGILKMAVIGMGKQHGAESVHQDGFSKLGEMLPVIAKVIFEKSNILGAVAVVENAFDQTCLISGMDRDIIFDKEPELLDYAKKRTARILFDDIDVLVVDKIGKDISGDGMDPNVTGRFCVPHIKGNLSVQHIAVLDLTENTHGNCNGLGLADVTTKRLVDKIDVDATYPNVLTSTVLVTPKIPMFTHSDKSCIQLALKTCNYIDREKPRIVHIKDTMHLGEIEVSESMLEKADSRRDIEVLSNPKDWAFNDDGNLW